jgi:hypothetical protein
MNLPTPILITLRSLIGSAEANPCREHTRYTPLFPRAAPISRCGGVAMSELWRDGARPPPPEAADCVNVGVRQCYELS